MNDEDRTLLLRAAQATGLTLSKEWDSTADGILVGIGDGDLKVWNPLDSGHDALNIAVKFGIFATEERAAAFRRYYQEELDADHWPTVATRRAITRMVASCRPLTHIQG